MAINLLSEIAFLLPGHPFRGAISAHPEGEARVVQMRDVAPTGEIGWADMVRTNLSGKKKPDWVVPGDILFVARGQRLFAVYMADVPFNAVPANQFIHLRLKPDLLDRVSPAFVAWQINQSPVQRQLASLATGTHLPSISKSVLSKLPIATPASVERQELIVTLDRQIKEETRAYQALIANRQDLMDSLAVEIMDEAGMA